MKIVIVGGGKLGYHLARNMLDRDYTVILIERDKLRCLHIANELDAEVINGDGTEIEVLARAGAGRADYFIAVTGNDQDNLVASQLAKKKFLVNKVIARANNPRNLEALRRLGADNAVSSTEIITRMIEQQVESVGMHLLASLNKGKASICTFIIPERSSLNNMALKDVPMPKSSLIISLVRGERLIIPQGNTIMFSGDEIVAVCDGNSQKELVKLFK
ncbi:MAG: TrkA family potassium uptake protein [Clostridiales bacterium]|jgi:trk system potassium uptake protein TrkA|nr:TrkA family potassium uptake protein [Clostridiales bacterium]